MKIEEIQILKEKVKRADDLQEQLNGLNKLKKDILNDEEDGYICPLNNCPRKSYGINIGFNDFSQEFKESFIKLIESLKQEILQEIKDL